MAQPILLSKVYIIAGPTASGKSAYAIDLARQLGGEVVNADSAQMYTRVSIGTAKPLDWATHEIKHHLFDICDQPVDFDVTQYRERILAVVADINARGKVPILVGGSLFYIKSLFFPPHQAHGRSDNAASSVPESVRLLSSAEQWSHLREVDPARAAQVHMHDTYRVMRALALWYENGVKPSLLVPTYKPPFLANIVFLSPPSDVLYDRINQRTEQMVYRDGWIEEVRGLMGDAAWRHLVETKGFIGYRELAAWIEAGGAADQLPIVVAYIQQETRNYAKRQRTFWRSFVRQLEEVGGCEIKEIDSA
ncbi:MAG: tRNA dimethylallyltransferase [Candidatus Dependentiae bacterium]|nr:tRNA dimethylallyltransferase [Candidatus Dependentiae bacterium]